jgi:prolyl-tRNA synthetase
MFNDADLLGFPVRLTVSARSLEQKSVETKLRHESDRGLIPRDDAVAWAARTLEELRAPLEERANAAPELAD